MLGLSLSLKKWLRQQQSNSKVNINQFFINLLLQLKLLKIQIKNKLKIWKSVKFILKHLNKLYIQINQTFKQTKHINQLNIQINQTYKQTKHINKLKLNKTPLLILLSIQNYFLYQKYCLPKNQTMNRQQPSTKQNWVTDSNVNILFYYPQNKKFSIIKNNFLNALHEQAKQGKIGYYDFLLVAKKLAFRFQQSSHLMALKNCFSKNKNLLTCKKLADYLSISQQSLISGNEQKIIVKFNVPEAQFAPIKQQTLEDEDFDEDRSMKENQYQQEGPFQKIGNQVDQQNERQLMQKMAIILSIKVEQMQKKILLLTHSTPNFSLLTYFDSYEQEQLSYEEFKKGIIDIISHNKEKIKLSEDDVKTIFHLLDEERNGFITLKQIEKLKNLQQSGLADKMKEFYKSRLNKDMVKNTLFKLGKVKNNSIQIYQLKNASLMQFKQMQDAIINHHDQSSRNKFNIRSKEAKQKNRIPHFGPLKGATKWRNKPQQTQSQPHYYQAYASTHPNTPNANIFSINKQRQKIEKILRQSKDINKFSSKAEKNGETVASKLRSLFIHKVILPRQKMLQQQKDKFLKSKIPEHQLSIKPLK